MEDVDIMLKQGKALYDQKFFAILIAKKEVLAKMIFSFKKVAV